MRATFKTFKSGIGDCIFFVINDEEEQFVMMVDCGKLEKEILDFVLNNCNGKIDLLIVTHIDDDHIAGVDTLLREYKEDVEIGEIIYNCYRRSPDLIKRSIKLPPNKKKLLDNLISELPVLSDMNEHNISAAGAFNLANTILDTPKYGNIWRCDTVTSASSDLDLKKWGKIRFLSPTIDDIERLNKVYLDYFFEKLFMKADGKKWKKGESIFEYIIRYADLSDYERLHDILIGAESISAEVLNKASEELVNTNAISVTNKASIAFVWESADSSKRVLFMGDANPETVSGELLNKYKGEAFPISFEAIKVSHHGSHYNTTKELMHLVDSLHYFFTGGEEGKRPDKSAIGRIVCRPINGNNNRSLHFNFITEDVQFLNKAKDLKRDLKFECDLTENEHVFEF